MAANISRQQRDIRPPAKSDFEIENPLTRAARDRLIRLNARLKGYKDHEAMLAGKYALAGRVWKEDPYHHDDY